MPQCCCCVLVTVYIRVSYFTKKLLAPLTNGTVLHLLGPGRRSPQRAHCPAVSFRVFDFRQRFHTPQGTRALQWYGRTRIVDSPWPPRLARRGSASDTSGAAYTVQTTHTGQHLLGRNRSCARTVRVDQLGARAAVQHRCLGSAYGEPKHKAFRMVPGVLSFTGM